MQYLCERHGSEALVIGEFNKLVAAALGSSYRFIFAEDFDGACEATYQVSVADLFGRSDKSHISQCFFQDAGLPAPALPITLDLRCEPCGLAPGVVISPYSRSDLNCNKLWPHDRWLSVIRALRDGGQVDRIYVVGAGGVDDPSPYVAEGVEPVFDKPLSYVLSLLRSSPLVMTVDNGIGHLVHYGGVANHVLLYPGCLSRTWVHNPRAIEVHAPMPIDIHPHQMIQAARTVLARPSDLSRCI